MPAIKTASGLTQKQEKFVAEYLIDGNGTRAAIAAGYAPKAAKHTASDLTRKPRVAAALEKARAKVLDKLELTAEKVLTDIARVSKKAEAAKEFSAALKGHEMLGKHLKLFTEKHEHGGIGGGPVVLQVTQADEDL